MNETRKKILFYHQNIILSQTKNLLKKHSNKTYMQILFYLLNNNIKRKIILQPDTIL